MNLSRTLSTACLLLLLSGGAACAQRGGGGGRGGRGGGMGPGGGDMGSSRMDMPGGGSMGGARDADVPRASTTSNAGSVPVSSGRSVLPFAPSGRWWDNKKFAKSLGINGDQQKRMDSVFSQNRDTLLSRYENLQRAQTRLEAVRRSGHPAEGALLSEIDRVAQARADLEKSNTHMLLQLRDELTPEQAGKLEHP